MRKLVLKMHISVDTVWQAGIHAMGSRTYYDMAAHWPTSTEPFAPPMNEIYLADDMVFVSPSAHGQKNRENASLTRHTLHGQVGIHPMGQLAADGETEPGALGPIGRTDLP